MAVGFGLLVILGVVVIPVLVILLVIALVRYGSGEEARWDPPEAAVRARRHELLIASVSALAAVVCVVVVLNLPVTGAGPGAPVPGFAQAMGPFVAVVVFCGVRAVGELTWPRPSGTVRTAPFVRRTVSSLGGARLRWLLATALALVAALVVFGLVAGEGGRQFDHAPVTWPDGSVSEASRGPFPGWPYGVPMLAGLVVSLAATLATLRLVARRSPLAEVPADHDAAVRATSAARLLGGVQFLVGAALGATLWIAGTALTIRPWEIPGATDLAWLSGVGAALMVVGSAIVLASGIAGLLTVLPRRPAVARNSAEQVNSAAQANSAAQVSPKPARNPAARRNPPARGDEGARA